VTGFQKADQVDNVTFDIIYICNYKTISTVIMYYNKVAKSITNILNYYFNIGNILEVCVCWNSKCSNMEILFILCMTAWSVFQNQVTIIEISYTIKMCKGKN